MNHLAKPKEELRMRTQDNDETATASASVVTRTVIWGACWDPGFCVHIPWPWNKDVCAKAHVCVRIVEDAGHYFIELELNGSKRQYDLVNACVPAFTIGPASLEVCVGNLVVQGGKIKSVDLTVKVCLGIDV